MDVLCREISASLAVVFLLYCEQWYDLCVCVYGQEGGPVGPCCVMPGSSALCGTFGSEMYKMIFFLFCSVLVFICMGSRDLHYVKMQSNLICFFGHA